jgi:hypothetical protein
MTVSRRAPAKLLRIHRHHAVAHTGIPIVVEKVRVLNKG